MILEDLFSSVLYQFKNIAPLESENLIIWAANRKNDFRGSFQFSIVSIKKISPLWKAKI